MAPRIIYEQSARDDLRAIFWWIVERAGPETARSYVQRIRNRCDRLMGFPDQGQPRDDIQQGLRTISFERTAIVVYITEDKNVRVLRVLRKGRDVRREIS